VVRKRPVKVEVVEIRAHVEVRGTGRVVDDQAGGIELFRPREGVLEPTPVGLIAEIKSPALVGDRPDDDAGVVEVPRHHALESGARPLNGRLRQQVPIGKLCPNQHPELVGDAEVSRVGHLYMAAQAVETEFLRTQNLLLEELSRWRCTDRVEVIVLVQGTQQVERFSVQ
jgi:hypothetical protein